MRTIAKVSGWAYSLSGNGVAVNLYGGNILATKLLDESTLKLSQETQYPWDGSVEFTIQECKEEAFDVMLRIPDWATGSKITINGKDADVQIDAGKYATINRKWSKGDVVLLDMPMDIKLLEGHPLIEEVRNQVTIKRGPVVYCVESTDLPKNTNILDVYLPLNSELTVDYQPELLGGISTINANVKLRKDKKDGMYRELSNLEWENYNAQFIPYFSWANRGEAEMTVWVPILME